ncbi:hypothetical protein [Mycobacterium sp.]|nr:hypothetical protein [Mycobacterium sp.]
MSDQVGLHLVQARRSAPNLHHRSPVSPAAVAAMPVNDVSAGQ